MSYEQSSVPKKREREKKSQVARERERVWLEIWHLVKQTGKPVLEEAAIYSAVYSGLLRNAILRTTRQMDGSFY